MFVSLGLLEIQIHRCKNQDELLVIIHEGESEGRLRGRRTKEDMTAVTTLKVP
jgi:hypothetical protein